MYTSLCVNVRVKFYLQNVTVSRKFSKLLLSIDINKGLQLRKSFEKHVGCFKAIHLSMIQGVSRKRPRLQNVLSSALGTNYRKGHLPLVDWSQGEKQH